MADLATVLTDDRMRALSRRLDGVYTEAYRVAVKNNEKAIEKLASLMDEALKDLTDEAKALKRRAFAREVERTEKLSQKIAAEIADAGKTASKIVQGEMRNIYGLNYDFSAFSIQRQAGLQLDFTAYDRNQIAVLVQEGQSPFTKIAYKNLGKDGDIVRRLQNNLLQATLNGESQTKIMQRIRGVTGQSNRQAKRVAQTERTRVQSQGRNQAIAEAVDMGVKASKQWVSRMDAKVRDDHAAVTGETVGADEAFSNGLEFPGDPSGAAYDVINCRCYVKPIVESVSPALKAHREKFARDVDFEGWRQSR